MIKVLHVVGIMNKGGIESLVLNIVQHSDRVAIRQEILCTIPGDGAYEPELAAMGVPVHKIGEEFSSHTGRLRYIGQYREYRKWFDRHEFNIIHIHGSHAFDVSIAAKAALDSKSEWKVVVHSHTASGEHARLNSVFSKYLSKAPVIRLSCSKPAANWLFGKGSAYTLVKNGIDVDKFRFNSVSRSALRKDLGLSADDKVLVHVGRLVPVKNHALLFNAVSQMHREGNPCKLLLVGDGPDREKLQDLTRELGIDQSVLFLGLRSDIPAILSASDVFVMPSYHEGLPMAAVEAQASGLPTVLSANVARETAISDQTEFLSIDEGATPWVAELSALLSGNGCSGARRSEAAEFVKASGFDIHATVNQLTTVYRESAGKM